MSTDTRDALRVKLKEQTDYNGEALIYLKSAEVDLLWDLLSARLLREDGERGGPLSTGKRGPRPDAADVLAKLDAASAMVSALCKPRGEPGAREWLMSIPARPDHDPDLVIGDALHAARKLILARPAVVHAAWLREFSRLQSALVEEVWRCADQDEADTPYEERRAEMDRAVKALYAHVESLAHPDAGSEARERVALEALRALDAGLANRDTVLRGPWSPDSARKASEIEVSAYYRFGYAMEPMARAALRGEEVGNG